MSCLTVACRSTPLCIEMFDPHPQLRPKPLSRALPQPSHRPAWRPPGIAMVEGNGAEASRVGRHLPTGCSTGLHGKPKGRPRPLSRPQIVIARPTTGKHHQTNTTAKRRALVTDTRGHGARTGLSRASRPCQIADRGSSGSGSGRQIGGIFGGEVPSSPCAFTRTL
jgi:hypothetical protein